MMQPCKRLKIEGDKLIDRLSDVPINVKHQIQEKLPINEAARMCVLSKSWTNVWSSIPKLIFSLPFCLSKPLHILIDIISTILLQHDGAIKSFLLNITSIPHSYHYIVDQWMYLLSKKGLNELTLQNLNNNPYNLPSYMCSLELQVLYLSNCIIKPQSSFRGFHKLKTLMLFEATLELDDVEASYLWMPNLESLLIKRSIGLDHLKISAPKLLDLSVFTNSCTSVKLDQFINSPKLKSVAFVKENQQDRVMNLNYLLNNWCNVRVLVLDSYYLKSFAFGTKAERLPTCLDNLRVLVVFYFDIDDENQLLSLLRMLRSFPNLENLVFRYTKKKGDMELVDVEEPVYTTQGLRLNKLKNLKIETFHSSRTELLFIRFIVASAPLLRKIILPVDTENVDESRCLNITRELMGFPRASPELEIICEPSKPAKKLLAF